EPGDRVEAIPLVATQDGALLGLEMRPFDDRLVRRRVTQDAVDGPARTEGLHRRLPPLGDRLRPPKGPVVHAGREVVDRVRDEAGGNDLHVGGITGLEVPADQVLHPTGFDGIATGRPFTTLHQGDAGDRTAQAYGLGGAVLLR